MYATNQLMFPPEVIPTLGDMRGPAWRELVERVARLSETHPESLAFTLLMIRLDGCLECETDSYRAMRGCQACAQQTLRRYKCPDAELLARYQVALSDVVQYLEEQFPARRQTRGQKRVA